MEVIGVKFAKMPKVYYFAAEDGVEYEVGKGVIVETARGVEYGTIALSRTDVPDEKLVQPVKRIMRFATEQDEKNRRESEEKRFATRATVREKVAKAGLNMKIVDVEFPPDGGKLVVYFTAESRVDFRDLVRDLASTFHMRIELRQIGARDECRMQGGVAPCGRACCCSDYISDFAHVTIKMAKNQGLSLNPGKISGLCGRLMCCLSYENEFYAEVNKRMPKVGSTVTLSDGREATVISQCPLKEGVRVKVEQGDSIELLDVSLGQVRRKNAPQHEAEEAQEKIDEELSDLLD